MKPLKTILIGVSQFVSFGLIWLIIFYVLLFKTADAGEPKFTPKASYQRAAVSVMVEVAGSYRYGSGIYVQQDNLRGVLTVAHLFDCGNKSCPVQDIRIKWADKTVSNTRVYTTEKNGHDLAFIFVTSSKYKPVLTATARPTVGQVVEFLTYGDTGTIGSGTQSLRHFPSRVKSVNAVSMVCNTPVIEGDSGGGILSWPGHQLVGIQSAGEPESNSQPFKVYKGRKIYRGSRVVGLAPIRAFLSRIIQAHQQGRFRDTGYQFYPCQQYPVYQNPPPQIGLFNRQQVIQPQVSPLPEAQQGDLWPDDNFDEVFNQPAPVQPGVDQNLVSGLQQRIDELSRRIDSLPPPATIPEIPPAATPEDIKTLQSQLLRLQQQLNDLSARPIDVELLNQRGEVIQKKTYPAGKPIRLKGTYSPATQGT